MKMTNGKKYISATEINKFIYCNYQWYYEKKYGAGKLRALHKERNEKFGFSDGTKSNFYRGQKFHRKYRMKEFLRSVLRVLLILIAIAVFIYFYLEISGLRL